MSRRAHKPEPAQRRQVEALAGYGVPEDDIASVIEVDAKTLRKHYRKELDQGHIKATAKVAESLYRKATGEGSQSVTAAIFWLKTRAGWKETVVQENVGISYVVRMPDSVESLDEWQRIYAPKGPEGAIPTASLLISRARSSD